MTTLLQAEDVAGSSTHAVGDEYIDWFRDVHKSDQNIPDHISYWYERREEYLRLSQMALDVLSVLPMSDDVERLFSTCGRMVRDGRAKLDASTIGMTQTVRSWLCGGYIKSTGKLLKEAKVPGTDVLAEMSFEEAREATGGRTTFTVPVLRPRISISTSIYSTDPLLASISIHSIQGGPKWTSIHLQEAAWMEIEWTASLHPVG
ncbi:putative AC9 transposase [Ilyonectria robusta]